LLISTTAMSPYSANNPPRIPVTNKNPTGAPFLFGRCENDYVDDMHVCVALLGREGDDEFRSVFSRHTHTCAVWMSVRGYTWDDGPDAAILSIYRPLEGRLKFYSGERPAYRARRIRRKKPSSRAYW
jgi:hypothetical protein